MAEALQKSAIQFKKPPEVRTNAVTVWYAEGHHIDLPVYRECHSFWGKTIEHAGSSWTKRDPGEISKWFTAQVRRHSPQKSASDTMPEDQMRRIVRYLKVFACSRESWGLPGGLLITTLVGECYRPHPARDDEALYDTMATIARRLHGSTTVYNPADHSVQLTTKEEHHGQLRRFRQRLDETSGGESENWEHTLYHGDHRMICEVRDSGMVVGRGERVIRVDAIRIIRKLREFRRRENTISNSNNAKRLISQIDGAD